MLSFLRLLYPAGAETTFNAMGAMLYRVLSDRAFYQQLVDKPALHADFSVVAAAA